MNIKNLKIYKEMLIIVDMVNGFVEEGALADTKIAEIIPRQIEIIKEAKQKKALIVFVKDTHEENSTEHKRFGGAKHCVIGTGEELVIDELKEYEECEDTVSIEKNSTSYIEAPEFRKLIKEPTNYNLQKSDLEVIAITFDEGTLTETVGYRMCEKNLDYAYFHDANVTVKKNNYIKKIGGIKNEY